MTTSKKTLRGYDPDDTGRRSKKGSGGQLHLDADGRDDGEQRDNADLDGAVDRDGRAHLGRARSGGESLLTDEALRLAALSYLDRYDASVSQLRNVLQRRVKKYGAASDQEAAHERIEALLTRFQESRLIDDARYAEGFAQSQRARGASSLQIEKKLTTRGISPDAAQTALRKVQDDGGQDEGAAARTYADKRRLAVRYDLTDPKEKQKALAALARQGFSFDVAERTLSSLTSGRDD